MGPPSPPGAYQAKLIKQIKWFQIKFSEENTEGTELNSVCVSVCPRGTLQLELSGKLKTEGTGQANTGEKRIIADVKALSIQWV